MGLALEPRRQRVEVDLLLVADHGGAGAKAKVGVVRPIKVCGADVLGQRLALGAIEPIGQRVVGSVPGNDDVVPGAVLDVADAQLGLIAHARDQIRVDVFAVISGHVAVREVLVCVEGDRETVRDAADAEIDAAAPQRVRALGAVGQDESDPGAAR